jgi:apolipoprotein N-acyltransferase
MKISIYLIAFVLGALSSFAFAPYFYFWVLFITSSVLLLLIERVDSKKSAFFLGWCFGLGHFMHGIYWIYNALMVDFSQFGWMIPFVVVGLPALLAIYVALAVVATYLSTKYRLVLFSIFWVIAEYLRGHLFSGFPWNLVGYSVCIEAFMQSAAIIGVYGLSFVVMLLSGLPYLYYTKNPQRHLSFIALFLIVASSYVYGVKRLENPTIYTEKSLRLVQYATKQTMHANEQEELKNLSTLIKMSKSNSTTFDYVLWPEGSFSVYVNDTLLSLVKEAITNKSHLIASGVTKEQRKYYNSLHLINHQGISLQQYHKVHLVPFGEYVPLARFLPIQKIVPGISDFSAGDKAHDITIQTDLAFRPLICYEDIFADEIKANKNTHWLVSLTNDAWFGSSNGPHQHFHMSRFRAIEQGLPLVRASRTGVSAIVDAYGRIISQTKLNKTAVLDGYLPKKIAKQTIYSKFGDSLILCILALLNLIALILLIIDKKYLKAQE